MQAAVLAQVGKPLEIQEVPDPSPGPGQIILRVRSCGICGSDLHWSAIPPGPPPGTVMGHEFSGEVVELGPDVGSAFALGDRVCAVPFIGCGRCAACLSGDVALCAAGAPIGLGVHAGAYAEYVRVGVNESLRLPDAVSDRKGALVEPLAVGLHAWKKAGLPAGARVLILGAGPIGLATALWARFFGARAVVVSEKAAARRDLAARFGATHGIDPTREEVAPRFEALAGAPADAVFECVGVPGLVQECLNLVRPRGRVVVVGVCMQPDTFLPAIGVMKEVSVQFVVAYEKSDFDFTLSMLEQRRIASEEMVTDVVGFDGFSAAFEALKQPSTQCKVMLEP